MITVITPFSRKQNKDFYIEKFKGKVNWVVLINEDIEFPEWVTVKKYELPERHEGLVVSNWLINQFITEPKALDPETQYMILCDDDYVEEGFWGKIPDTDVVLVSMRRGDKVVKHVVWDDFKNQKGHWEQTVDILLASPENLKIARVGGEQLILKGKILKDYRYGLSNIGDGEMILKVAEEHAITYVPNAYVLFNWLEENRYSKKPTVLFVGDYFCAGQPSMGISEWEGNIANSLDSTGLVNVLTFHFDYYYYNSGRRGDQELVQQIDKIKPDYIVLIIYKQFGQDPAVMEEGTLAVIQAMGVPVITIWGDLEAQQQVDISKTVAPYCWKMIGTANKEVVEKLGYTYMHVPKDPRLFNNPEKTRDIDIVFSGSYGLGREERQGTMLHLINNGINLIHGGSEGRDHFSTEEYADRYKRSKLALSFSRAHGINVVNARPFEAMSCGAMLLEQESPELAKLFTPGVDYVEWKTDDDLLEKVRYYLAHDEERLAIARSGQKKIEELYSAKKFWEEALKR